MTKIQSTDQQAPMVRLPIPSTMAGPWGQKGQKSKWQYFWFGELKYFCGQAMDLGTQSIQDPAFRNCRGDRRDRVGPGERRPQMERVLGHKSSSTCLRVLCHSQRIREHVQPKVCQSPPVLVLPKIMCPNGYFRPIPTLGQ